MERTTLRIPISTLLYYGAVLLLGYLMYRIFEPFFGSLIWAAILVILFYPWHLKLKGRFGASGGAVASTAIVTVLLIVPALVLAFFFVHETIHVGSGLGKAYNDGRFPWLNDTWDWAVTQFGGDQGFDLPTLIHNAGSTIAGRAALVLGFVVRHTAKFFFDLFVTLFALFFLFRDADFLTARIKALLPFERSERDLVASRTQEMIFATVTTSLAIAAMQGVIGGLAFWMTGITTPFFWGVMIAFFSLIPVVGSTLIWVPAAAWLFATAHPGRGVVMILMCGALMSVVEHVVRPVLLAGRLHLSALFVFIGVLGGLSVFGILGLVLGPVLVAAAAGFLEACAEE